MSQDNVINDNTRFPIGKYKGVRIGLIPTPILRAELDLSSELRKRKHSDLRAFMQQKIDLYDTAREDSGTDQ